MRITYDPVVDVLRILFANTAIEESDEEEPGIISDYDKGGNIVGDGNTGRIQTCYKPKVCGVRRCWMRPNR